MVTVEDYKTDLQIERQFSKVSLYFLQTQTRGGGPGLIREFEHFSGGIIYFFWWSDALKKNYQKKVEVEVEAAVLF